MQNAICLLVDRLHAGYLGCYGNAWISTPAFDRLAAESFVFDQALANATSLEQLYGGYFWGAHPLERSTRIRPDSLPRQLSAAGVRTAWITDEPQLAQGPLPREVNELVYVDAPGPPATARSLDDTRVAAIMATAIEWLASASEPFCLWVHTSSLAGAWDAPLDYRHQYADPDEPLPPDLVVPPKLVLDEGYDPDELLGYTQSYAGQVSALDECLAGLLDFASERKWSASTLLAVCGVRGIALGEHRRVGCWDEALCGELLHVPSFVRLPEGAGRAARSQALVEPGDLAMTLAEWCGAPAPGLAVRAAHSLLPIVRDEVAALRDRICIVGPSGERAIRTPGWHVRWPGPEQLAGDDTRSSRWLYVKPDDRFEMNDVADRCPDIVDALERVWDETAAAMQAGSAAQPAALPAELLADLM